MSSLSSSSSSSLITGEDTRNSDTTASDGTYMYGNGLNGLASLSSSSNNVGINMNNNNGDNDHMNCNNDDDDYSDHNDDIDIGYAIDKNGCHNNDNSDTNGISNVHEDNDDDLKKEIVKNVYTEIKINTKNESDDNDSNNGNDINIHDDVYSDNIDNESFAQKVHNDDYKNNQNYGNDHKRRHLSGNQKPVLCYESFTSPPPFDLNDFALS